MFDRVLNNNTEIRRSENDPQLPVNLNLTSKELFTLEKLSAKHGVSRDEYIAGLLFHAYGYLDHGYEQP